MYSGTTLTKYSGRILGAHQRLDRVAYRHLSRLECRPDYFPKLSSILYFEGKNGPDGIKSKSTGIDEPWHFYDPFDPDDINLLQDIAMHAAELSRHLTEDNHDRSAFEASWLAHALVDGMTPAHHFPYEAELERIRGEGMYSRDSIVNKLIIKGNGIKDTARRNWNVWGAKGLITSHGLFELGVASLLISMHLGETVPTKKELDHVREAGPVEIFKHNAEHIASLELFEIYLAKGWTPKLASLVRHELVPRLVKVITLAWYDAIMTAEQNRKV